MTSAGRHSCAPTVLCARWKLHPDYACAESAHQFVGSLFASLVAIERRIETRPVRKLVEAGFAQVRAAQPNRRYAPFAERQEIKWTFDQAHAPSIEHRGLTAEQRLAAGGVPGSAAQGRHRERDRRATRPVHVGTR